MKKFFLSLVCMAFAGVVLAQNAQLPQNVTLKTLDGQSVQTSTIQNDGKPIIISFWATWCKPCHVELNTINEVYEEWQNETGVKLVAVSIDDARRANKVKPDVAGMGWEYEIYLDQNQDFWSNTSFDFTSPRILFERIQAFIQAHGVDERHPLDKMEEGAVANLDRAYSTMIPLFSTLGAEQADRVMKYGQQYLDLFPNGKARTEVENCMNKAKADLPAKPAN